MFEVKLGKLFDIVIYKFRILLCDDFSNCEGCEAQAHIICDCKDDQKIPEFEVLYVLDQRSRKYGSNGKFGGRDKKIKMEKMVEQ